jgi:hypothetical protein
MTKNKKNQEKKRKWNIGYSLKFHVSVSSIDQEST